MTADTADLAEFKRAEQPMDAVEAIDLGPAVDRYVAEFAEDLAVREDVGALDVLHGREGMETGREYHLEAGERRATAFVGVEDYAAADAPDVDGPQRDLVLRYRAGDPVLYERLGAVMADVLDPAAVVEGSRETRFALPQARLAEPY